MLPPQCVVLSAPKNSWLWYKRKDSKGAVSQLLFTSSVKFLRGFYVLISPSFSRLQNLRQVLRLSKVRFLDVFISSSIARKYGLLGFFRWVSAQLKWRARDKVIIPKVSSPFQSCKASKRQLDRHVKRLCAKVPRKSFDRYIKWYLKTWEAPTTSSRWAYSGMLCLNAVEPPNGWTTF